MNDLKFVSSSVLDGDANIKDIQNLNDIQIPQVLT